jgi:hypothetical protein
MCKDYLCWGCGMIKGTVCKNYNDGNCPPVVTTPCYKCKNAKFLRIFEDLHHVRVMLDPNNCDYPTNQSLKLEGNLACIT